MTLSAKDPAEIITITFDFAGMATGITNPVVSISVKEGVVDQNAAAMRDGNPQIAGTSVLQRVKGGLSGNTYKLRCEADDADGEHWVLADTLPVQTS